MSWASYSFFNPRPLTDIQELHKLNVTSASECHSKVIIGTDSGEVYVATKPGAPLEKTDLSFPGPVLHIMSAIYSQRVLFVFRDENANFIFQVFNLSDYSPLFQVKFPDSIGVSDVSFLTCSPKLSRFAFTLDRRTFYIYSLPESDKSIEKFQIIENPPITKTVESFITGLFLTNDSQINKYIYVLCKNSISSYDISSRGSLKFSFDVKEGFDPSSNQKLACIGPQGRLYVCRDNVVSIYSNSKGKRDALKVKEIVLDESPRVIYWFRQYLVCCMNDDNKQLRIYEPATHCVFFSFPNYGRDARFFLNEWSGLTIIMNDGQIVVLDEPPTEQKIQKLCTYFNQFEVALKLAKKQKLPPTVIADIHKTKADKAYNRKSYEEAIKEYIFTIGSLEPSYVIKKFLDPQHASLLITYLEALESHESSQSSTTASTKGLHTTLLFNCYTKLKQTEIIRKRVELASEYATSNNEPPFDIDAAIDVLSHSGYPEFAEQLAKSFNKHETYMRILYDSNEPMKIFYHLSNLNANDVDQAIQQYGGWIMSRMDNPVEQNKFADFIASICTTGVTEKVDGIISRKCCKPDHFKMVFSEKTEKAYYHFLTKLCNSDPTKLSEVLWNDYISTALSCDIQSLNKIMAHPNANYSTEQALIILQQPALKLKELKRKYDNAQKANKPDPILEKINYNDDIVVPLGFIKSALITLYDKRKVYAEILDLLPTEKIPNACETYGEYDSNFWLEGLREAIKRNNGPTIKDIVRKIHIKKLFPLNSLLKPKTSLSEFTLGVFSEYIQEDFASMQKEIEEKSRELAELDANIQKDQKLVHQLRTQYFIAKPVTCANCKLPIDRPSYHFLCGHAYHKHCLEGGAEVCKICKQGHLSSTQAKINKLEKVKNENDILQKLRQSDNPQETLNSLLEDGFFFPEVEFGGENIPYELSSRLQALPQNSVQFPTE